MTIVINYVILIQESKDCLLAIAKQIRSYNLKRKNRTMNIQKVLVIDDQPCNVASAHLTLKGFDYKVVDTIKAAYEILGTGEKFDVVLTDLWLPRGGFTGAMAGGDTAETPIPAGLVFALRAANDGMKVVICTDSDHHRDRLCSLLDLIKGGILGKEKSVYYVEARECPVEGTWENGEIVLCNDWYKKSGRHPKNWLEAMKVARLIQ